MLELEERDRTRFAAAMLRVVLALKREPSSDLEALVARAIGETGVNADRFRQFLTTRSKMITLATVRRN